jgi:hypothetical protein
LEEYRALKIKNETKIEKEEETANVSYFDKNESPPAPIIDLKKIVEKKKRENIEFFKSILILLMSIILIISLVFNFKK